MRVRGLKVENKLNDGKEFICKVEIVCESEEAFGEFVKLASSTKQKITFSYIRLMGDNFDTMNKNKMITLGQKAYEALMEGFATGLFFMTYEFRIYNFKQEVTPLLAFVDSLVGNPSL